MADDDLVPLKLVLDEVGVSRATLWRVLKSDIEGIPAPTRQRGRLFWRRAEIAQIDAALDAYGGRGEYERQLLCERTRVRERHAELLETKKKTRRRRRRQTQDGDTQPDLFGQ